IKSTLFSLSQLLSNDNNGIVELSFQAERTVAPISSYTSKLESLAARIGSIQLEIQDLADEVNQLESEVTLEPEQLSMVQDRVNLINQLLQKHQVQTESELISIRNELKEKLTQIEGGDEKIIERKKELDRELLILEQLGNELSQLRLDCASSFEKELINHLTHLGMPEAKFKIEFIKTNELEPLGNEIIEFGFTANKGVGLKKVHESASGGELSRILLAIKSIVSNKTNLPTIVFDEIDTGVSGEVANKMGDLMKLISKKIQVLAITHLPQIAAKGNAHYSVYKDHNSEKTLTKIELLEGDNRVIELAKMLSGDKLSTVAKENARILLDN
ncbi:DNA repair protein RecN, partial [Salibacteraceae bacterium]|nr:DNA repair protein RecN [Salibacteraceae bacterium]